jgi:hypothetical protein
MVLDHTGAAMTAIEIEKELRPENRSAYTAARRLALALGAIRQAIWWRMARRRMRSNLPVKNPS